MTILETLGADRVVALVRAPEIPDAAELSAALARGGIRVMELTFTTPSVERHIAAVSEAGGIVGAGTVLTGAQAASAIEAGAQFLVTPGIVPAVAEVAADAGVELLMGALTPSEVLRALELGAAAVKIFPAQTVGPAYFRHLSGPLPGVPLVASGGIDSDNARVYLDSGAYAVTAGSGVVRATDLAASDWPAVERLAREFTASL
ncbi:MAG: bifunctional 4-hydroxy-2-oxoglutarate aldolase/2-dehydro-3-deoxy-phosphogluconate aldolase [Brevundimonas sp.]